MVGLHPFIVAFRCIAWHWAMFEHLLRCHMQLYLDILFAFSRFTEVHVNTIYAFISLTTNISFKEDLPASSLGIWVKNTDRSKLPIYSQKMMPMTPTSAPPLNNYGMPLRNRSTNLQKVVKY